MMFLINWIGFPRDVDEKSNRLRQTLDCGRVRKHWFSKSGFSSTSLACCAHICLQISKSMTSNDLHSFPHFQELCLQIGYAQNGMYLAYCIEGLPESKSTVYLAVT
jgi:hypothetical protein